MQNDYNLSINAIDTRQSSSPVWAVIFFLTTLGGLTSTYWFYKKVHTVETNNQKVSQKQEHLRLKISELQSNLTSQKEKQRQLGQDNLHLNKQNESLKNELNTIKRNMIIRLKISIQIMINKFNYYKIKSKKQRNIKKNNSII